MADEWCCPFFETSARNKINHEDCFFECVRQSENCGIEEKIIISKWGYFNISIVVILFVIYIICLLFGVLFFTDQINVENSVRWSVGIIFICVSCYIGLCLGFIFIKIKNGPEKYKIIYRQGRV